MPRCYLPDAAAGAVRVALPDTEAHHVAHVLRLRAGDAVIIFDGRGHEWDARIVAVSKAEVTIDLGAARTPVAEPTVFITLGVGLLKGDQMDAVVSGATVLGATRIVPMVTQHVTVPERVWAREGLEARWLRVAVAAAKQCGRAVVPEIAPVTPVEDVIARAEDSVRVVCVEPALGETANGLGPKPAAALLCIGPEGGWSAAELARLSPGARRLSLGPRTLRAELAPVVALTAVWSTWGWS